MKRKPKHEISEVAAKRQYLRQQNKNWPDLLIQVPEDQWPEQFGQNAKVQTLEVWRSCHFLVQIIAEGPGRTRITVNRTKLNKRGNDWEDGITWDELMAIKTQIGRADQWAVEIYPPAASVVNVANMRHLWLLDEVPAQGWNRSTKPHL